MEILALLVAVILFLLSEAFFSGSEIAIISSNRIRIKVLADQGIKRASLVQKLLKKPERLLATTLIGTNASVIASSFAANELFAELFGRRYSGFAILILIPLILLFGEIVPKSISMRNAERISLFSIYPLYLTMITFYPLIILAGSLATMLFGRARLHKRRKNPFVTREELKIIIKSEKNLKGRYEKTFLNRILSFAEGTVKEHMTPSFKIVSTPRKSMVREVVQTITRSGYSRIPIYEGERGNIIGIVDAKDLLESINPTELIESKIRKVLVVKEEEKIQNLLKDFQRERCHLSLVKNKLGKLTGIITIEDVLEEIVGQILDEFDKPMESYSTF